MESIRAHYEWWHQPTCTTLASHADFFALFGSLNGHLHSFHLEVLIAGAPSPTDTIPADAPIGYPHPLRGWDTNPFPAGVDEDRVYGERSLAVVRARNVRIGARSTRQAEALDGAPHRSGRSNGDG